MNESEHPDDIIEIETAYTEGFRAGKKAAAEQIFADIESAMQRSKTTLVGQQFYHVVLENYIEELKKKYGVK